MLSVIIPTHDRARVPRRCLGAEPSARALRTESRNTTAILSLLALSQVAVACGYVAEIRGAPFRPGATATMDQPQL